MTTRRFRIRPSVLPRAVASIANHPANRDHRIRGVAHVAVCEARARITGKPVVTPLGKHTRMLAYLHRGGSWRVVRANPPDFAEMSVWRSRLRAGDLFVDVGAHAGLYTLWALESGARVVAIEPVREMVAQLDANLALNGYRADVITGALGSAPGTLRLAGPDLLRQHLVLASDASEEHDESAGAAVPVTTLDEVVGDARAAGVKIDVEGAERLVVEGGSRALGEQRIDLLQLEWNDASASLLGEDREPVAQLLRHHGYVIGRPDGSGRLTESAQTPSYGRDVFAWPEH